MKRNNAKYTHGRTSVYNVNYHIIWGTKYRRPVLTTELKDSLKEILYQIADEKGFSIEHMEIGLDDHIHMLISAPPKLSITTIVSCLKGTSAFRLFRLYPELKKQYWKTEDRHLWSPSYFVETIGTTNQAAVAKYIDDQTSRKNDIPTC